MVRNDSPTEISGNVRELIEKHHAFYEVSPSYVLLQEPTAVAAPTSRRIQAGFDVDVYGIRTSHESQPSPAYEFAYRMLKDVAAAILANTEDSCSIEVIPFRSALILDTRQHFQPLAVLRIQILHHRGLDQPAGAAEQIALKALEEKLHGAGLVLLGHKM